MKRMLALTLCLLIMVPFALADETSAAISYGDSTYEVYVSGVYDYDDEIEVDVDGFPERLAVRDGQVQLPATVKVQFQGKLLTPDSIRFSYGDWYCYFDRTDYPEAVWLQAEGQDSLVLLWQAEGYAAQLGVTEDVLNALDNARLRKTYTALLAGEILEQGDQGEVADGLQELLIAFGRKGRIGDKVGKETINMLHRVQTAFGLENTDTVDVDGFRRLLHCLLIYQDPEQAEHILCDDSDAYDYSVFKNLEGHVYAYKGLYYSAKQAYYSSYEDGWEERMAACVQDWPANGVIMTNVKNANVDLDFQVNQDSDTAIYIKIYDQKANLVATLFIGGTGSASVRLAAGTYTIKDGTGTDWYGPEESFGYEGNYEVMTFDDGITAVTLQAGHSYQITVNAIESSPDSKDIGSEYEPYEDF